MEHTRNIRIETRLPTVFAKTGHSEALGRLIGATILRIGTPGGRKREGGGFAIQYRSPGATEAETIIFAFNDSGLWIEDR